jgi:ribonuclease D
MKERLPTPDKDAIALLEPFDRLDMAHIRVVSSAAEADAALVALQDASVLGFDTESKPTFARHEVSDGPHIVQFSTGQTGFIFQLQDSHCRTVVARLLADANIIKAGFGLGDDRKRIIHKLGVDPQSVLDLNHVFHARGYRKDMGVKGAVAVLFNRRFLKSKKAATSNWALPRLSESQQIYAANDAYAALRVYEALTPGAP